MTNIKRSEMGYLNDALWMGSGYVLDFSDRTFAEFFDSELGIDIEDERYRRLGSSKAKRLRCFLQTEGDSLVAKVLRALWAHRERVTPQQSGQEDTEAIRKRYFEIVHRLEGGGSLARTDPIDRFARDETLEERRRGDRARHRSEQAPSRPRPPAHLLHEEVRASAETTGARGARQRYPQCSRGPSLQPPPPRTGCSANLG